MTVRNYVLTIIVLLLSQFALAQSEPELGVAKAANVQPPAEPSSTYSDTIRLLKKWIDTNENEQMAHLFAIGDLRALDLLTACRNEEEEIASVAFFTLQLLGVDDGTCSRAQLQKRGTLMLSSPPDVTDADFSTIDRWLAKRWRAKGYTCRNEKDEPFIDEALIYALILDGSNRSKSALKRLLAFEKTCEGSETVLAEALQDASSVTAAARARTRNVQVAADTLENSIRASAFFLPTEYRDESDVQLLARNSKDDRILLEVSYRCGRLCGRGYYVVLRKNGAAWQYAIIRMIWIS